VPEEYTKPYANLKGERRLYAGMLAAMDEAVGQIVAAIEKKGVRDNTLFISPAITADWLPRVTSTARRGQGHAVRGASASLCRVGRHIKAGTTVNEPLHMVDWYPTVLKLAGASLEQKLPLDGKDAWATIAEGKQSPHDDIVLNVTPSGGAIRAGDWKLVTNAGPEKAELFDLKNDPYEKENLAEKMPDRVKALREARRLRQASRGAEEQAEAGGLQVTESVG
jgi:arylsulfatase A-like enzyme